MRLLMVIVSILPNAEFGPNDHREDATHFSVILIKYRCGTSVVKSELFTTEQKVNVIGIQRKP